MSVYGVINFTLDRSTNSNTEFLFLCDQYLPGKRSKGCIVSNGLVSAWKLASDSVIDSFLA